MTHCPLCFPDHETVLWRNAQMRVIAVHDNPQIPAYCRVIWQAHTAEMSDLDRDERIALMDTVSAVEQAMRTVFAPDKINLAALGNQVPHLHWHIIGRFADDAYFPDSVWAAAKREKIFRLPENAFAQIAKFLHADTHLAQWKAHE